MPSKGPDNVLRQEAGLLRWPPANGAVCSMPFDSPLPTALLNIEAKARSNLFPWRGQFSPQLVEALLRAYAQAGSLVLDPFMGSGTVLVEAARRGLPVQGYEVNPAAFLLARVYELCNTAPPVRQELLSKAEAILTRVRPGAFELPLFRGRSDTPVPPAEGVGWLKEVTDPLVRSLLEALVVLLDRDAHCGDSYIIKWSIVRHIVSDLPHSQNVVRASLGDARELPLRESTVDFVLSSPPYINVFNYHHNSRSAIESLGWRPLVVARSEIGSNRKFRQNRFLTVVQYCIDMALALVELRRVCKPSARVLLILGRESNVHKTAFYNGDILSRLAVQVVGFRLALTQERVFLNRFGQRIYEDILHLSPGPNPPLSKPTITQQARTLGEEVLAEALARVPADRKHFLTEAISRATEVQPSPILRPERARRQAL